MTAARPFLRRSCTQQPRGERIELEGPVFADNHGAANAGQLAIEHAIGFETEGQSRGQLHMFSEGGYFGELPAGKGAW